VADRHRCRRSVCHGGGAPVAAALALHIVERAQQVLDAVLQLLLLVVCGGAAPTSGLPSTAVGEHPLRRLERRLDRLRLLLVIDQRRAQLEQAANQLRLLATGRSLLEKAVDQERDRVGGQRRRQLVGEAVQQIHDRVLLEVNGDSVGHGERKRRCKSSPMDTHTLQLYATALRNSCS